MDFPIELLNIVIFHSYVSLPEGTNSPPFVVHQVPHFLFWRSTPPGAPSVGTNFAARQRCDVQTLPTRTDLDLTSCQEKWQPWWLPSGKRTKNDGKSPFLMGKPWENHGEMVIYMENHHVEWENPLFLWGPKYQP